MINCNERKVGAVTNWLNPNESPIEILINELTGLKRISTKQIILFAPGGLTRLAG